MERKRCRDCGRNYRRECFHKKQWNAGVAGRRCIPCHNDFHGIKSNNKTQTRDEKKTTDERLSALLSAHPKKVQVPMSREEEMWRSNNSVFKKAPAHPYDKLLSYSIDVHNTFEVSSGAIRFGPSAMVQGDINEDKALELKPQEVASYNDVGPSFVPACDIDPKRPEGSAKKRHVEAPCSFRAYNGNWNVYKLETKLSKDLRPVFNPRTGEHAKHAWFVCHSAMRPVAEARTLLYHGYFGHDAIRMDGAPGVKYRKQIEYQRIEYADEEWEQSNASCGYFAADFTRARSENSGSMITDGPPREQTCIIGFLKGDAAKSFLIFDDDCEIENLYFNNVSLPLYHMPWSIAAKVKRDKNDARFFVLDSKGVKTKHQIIFNLSGEAYATKRSFHGNMGLDDAMERTCKRFRPIQDFFKPISRTGNFSALTQDVTNPRLLPFLELRDCLRLAVTCKELNRTLDVLQYAYLYDDVKTLQKQLGGYDIDDVKDFLPVAAKGNFGELRPGFSTYVEWQNNLICKRTLISDSAVRSIMQNKVMWRHYISSDEPEYSFWSDANGLVREIVEGLITNNRLKSLEHICCTGRGSVKDLEFAIFHQAKEAKKILQRFGNVTSGASTCCDKCGGGLGVFSCRRKHCCASLGPVYSPEDLKKEKYYCEGCISLNRYCQQCNKYECEKCKRISHTGNWFQDGRYDAESEERLGPHERKVSYRMCKICNIRLCCVGNSDGCALECDKCDYVVCRKCNGGRLWIECYVCSTNSKFENTPIWCLDCSHFGCPEHKMLNLQKTRP